MSRGRAQLAPLVLGAAAAGCGSHAALPPDGGSPGTTASQTLTWSEAGKVQADILFMIDSGGSEESAHANLKANLGSFMDVLKALPGGLPDLHIAVITADMGAGDGTSIIGCSLNGDNGAFHYRPSGGCVSVGFTDPNATFIVDSGGGSPQTNFGTQDVTTVLECIIDPGSSGCGFRQQLGSIARALGADGAAPPSQNVGFLRPDALLAIVMLTDADDCSAPPGSPLFDPISGTLNSMYGPTQHFLCNEWGHLCVPPGGGAPVQPSRFAPTGSVTDTVVYTPAMATVSNCQSFEQSPVMTAVGALADGIKALKADPANQILITALVGMTEGPDSEGYTVSWRTPPTPDTGPWPGVDHACGDATAGMTAGFADPAVRIEQFVRSFGANVIVDNFCQADYGASLTNIATTLARMTAPPCFSGQVAWEPGVAVRDCAVTENAPDPSNPANTIATNIPACDTTGTEPCWQLAPATAQCQGGSVIVSRTTPAPDGATLTATCALCIAGQPDPSRGCP